MEFKKVGSSSVQVPEIGMGTWGYRGGVEPLLAGIDHGACFIDTAEDYRNEETVGQAIRGQRQKVFLATKVSPRNFRRPDLIRSAEASLRRLGTDYIDLYQLHWQNYKLPIEEPMAGMADLVDAGKIRFIGVSNFSLREFKQAQAALSKYRIASNQVEYSLVDRTIERGLLPYCQANGVTIIAYSPFRMRFDRIRAADPNGVLARTAAAAGKTEAQVALNWLIAKPNVVAIPKASSVAHAVDNCGASGWRLAPAQYEALESEMRFHRHGNLYSAYRYCRRYALQRIGYSQ